MTRYVEFASDSMVPVTDTSLQPTLVDKTRNSESAVNSQQGDGLYRSTSPIITRVSGKPEISYRFRKVADQAEISSWLSVRVPTKNKHFNQKGVFKISNFWDEQTIRRLEELSLRSDTLLRAVEESERSQPSMPPIEELKDLQRSGYHGRVLELTSPYVIWAERYESAKRTWNEALAELASLFADMVRQRSDLPEKLLAHLIPLEPEGAKDERIYVLYRSAVWSSEQELKPEQWQILVDRFLEREQAELAAALTPLALGQSERTRERIPPEVRRAVWIRDQGKCARCGSRERLEYDHIIPVSRGGGNTERNIELLCEFHNRRKSSIILEIKRSRDAGQGGSAVGRASIPNQRAKRRLEGVGLQSSSDASRASRWIPLRMQ